MAPYLVRIGMEDECNLCEPTFRRRSHVRTGIKPGKSHLAGVAFEAHGFKRQNIPEIGLEPFKQDGQIDPVFVERTDAFPYPDTCKESGPDGCGDNTDDSDNNHQFQNGETGTLDPNAGQA